MTELIFACPHCELMILVYKKEINCRIFRHGVTKKNFKQIGPHSSKSHIDLDKIYGCGKPFKLNKKNEAIKCGYDS